MKRFYSYKEVTSAETDFSSKDLSLSSVSLEDVLGLLRETADSSLEPEAECRFWTLRADLIQLVAEWYSLTSKRVNCGNSWSRIHLLFRIFGQEVEKTQTVSEITLERNLRINHEDFSD